MVERNICCGVRRPFPLESMREAACRANIAADIERLPGAYFFTVSERKPNLAGVFRDMALGMRK